MATIRTTKTDVIWNYVGTVVSMASGFVLLPLLMHYLTSEELGLWYVFTAVASLAMLFEFGFSPTFARNIVYVVSGARRITSEGCDSGSVREGTDWHLLKTVIYASKMVYAGIAVLVALVLGTFGTCYIGVVAELVEPLTRWVSWVIFVISIFLNLYFLYTITLLRGFGDIAGENRAKTLARFCQLLISALLLVAGAGLIGASLGYLMNGVLLRLFAAMQLSKHVEINAGIKSDSSAPTKDEIGLVFSTVSHVAWRDGLVQLACYASTHAMSLVGSLTLGLSETGTYSVLLQFGNAVYSFAAAYPSSFFPSFQAAHVEGNVTQQRLLVAKSFTLYWLLFMVGAMGVAIFIMPLLPYIKRGFVPDQPLFLMICLYLALWNHHSLACNFIIGMNEIPYLAGYIFAAFVGVPLSYALSGVLGWGPWGLVLGQAISQLLYNNWKWPMYLARKLGTTYLNLLHIGCEALKCEFDRHAS